MTRTNYRALSRPPSGAPHITGALATGSAEEITELMNKYMFIERVDPHNFWPGRGMDFFKALIKPLVFLRDNHGLVLSEGLFRRYFNLGRTERLCWRDASKYAGLEQTLADLRSFLINRPYYRPSMYLRQHAHCNDEYLYLMMELSRAFDLWAEAGHSIEAAA